ncbi:MAG TPA: DHHA1 domain-containing protein, partial [Candidatus Omnitrophota bacterium]|nr:DHHA1 domain-containing protein [Candidatus Omnitrophota bacterium]
NVERQQLQKTMIQEALNMVERDVNFNKEKVIVLVKEGWHKGVLGIVASKIVETFYRPAVIVTLENGVATGSARSIDGFHLHEALTSCSDVLEDFGGHRLAAGLTFRQEHTDELRRRLNDYAQSFLKPEDLTPVLLVDAEVPLRDLTVDLVNRIDLLEPYGEGNRPPVFCTRNLTVKSHPMCLAKETLKFWVSDGETTLSVVGFGMGKFKNDLALNQVIDVAYELAIDDWNKEPTAQLRLKDIRLVSS